MPLEAVHRAPRARPFVVGARLPRTRGKAGSDRLSKVQLAVLTCARDLGKERPMVARQHPPNLTAGPRPGLRTGFEEVFSRLKTLLRTRAPNITVVWESHRNGHGGQAGRQAGHARPHDPQDPRGPRRRCTATASPAASRRRARTASRSTTARCTPRCSSSSRRGSSRPSGGSPRTIAARSTMRSPPPGESSSRAKPANGIRPPT